MSMNMNMHSYVAEFAKEAGVEVDATDISRIVAVLRTAGFRYDMDEQEMQKARSIIAVRIGRVSGAKPRVTEAEEEKDDELKEEKKEDRVVEGSKDISAFEKIDAMVKQGKCARCGHQTEKVSLANYEEAYFCPQCRTTLW